MPTAAITAAAVLTSVADTVEGYAAALRAGTSGVQARIREGLDSRADVSVKDYDQLIDSTPAAGTADAKLDPDAADELTGGKLSARGGAVLTAIHGYRREYAWLEPR